MSMATISRWRAIARPLLQPAPRPVASQGPVARGRPDPALCRCSNLTARLLLWATRHVDREKA
jgi:hypothetical protein